MAELFGAAGAEAHAYASDDPEVAQEAIRRGAEAEGLETAQIFGLLVATVVALVLIVVAVFFMVLWQGQVDDVRRQTELMYPELADIRRADTQALTSYRRVEEGVYAIPLTRAQALIASEARAEPVPDAIRLPENRGGLNLTYPRFGSPGVISVPGSIAEGFDRQEAEALMVPLSEPATDQPREEIIPQDDPVDDDTPEAQEPSPAT